MFKLNKHYPISKLLQWASTWAKEGARLFIRKGDIVYECYEDNIGEWMVINKYQRV